MYETRSRRDAKVKEDVGRYDRGARHIKKSAGHLFKTASMKYQFIDKYRSVYRMEKMCRILDIGRSSYYTWKNRSKSMRDKENESLVFKIKLFHGKSRRIYGSPRITAELRASGVR